RVVQALIAYGGEASPEVLVNRSGLADSAVARAVLNLAQSQLVKERVEKKTELRLTEEGEFFASEGLPERRIVSIVKKSGGRRGLKEALQRAGLDERYGRIVTGWISRKRWGQIERENSHLQIVVDAEPAGDQDEEILARLKSGASFWRSFPRT